MGVFKIISSGFFNGKGKTTWSGVRFTKKGGSEVNQIVESLRNFRALKYVICIKLQQNSNTISFRANIFADLQQNFGQHASVSNTQRAQPIFERNATKTPQRNIFF
jgi:hypothetical protein